MGTASTTGTRRQCAHCEEVFPGTWVTGGTWRDLWFCSPGCHREWVEQAADPYNPERER